MVVGAEEVHVAFVMTHQSESPQFRGIGLIALAAVTADPSEQPLGNDPD